MNCDSDADDTETILPTENKELQCKDALQPWQNFKWTDFMTIAVYAGIHCYFLTSFVEIRRNTQICLWRNWPEKNIT